jgi:hypothetical protein
LYDSLKGGQELAGRGQRITALSPLSPQKSYDRNVTTCPVTWTELDRKSHLWSCGTDLMAAMILTETFATIAKGKDAFLNSDIGTRNQTLAVC